MKQLFRLFVQPWTFFNQLQWSSHHWFIMVAFAIAAFVETHFGNYDTNFSMFAQLLQIKLGTSETFSIWMVSFGRLALMLAGLYFISWALWYVGNFVGTKHSVRVLFRRLAIVLSVSLMGYTINHIAYMQPQYFPILAKAFYLWGALLGYFALREQFDLNTMETIAVSAIALLMVVSSWHYSSHALNTYARKSLNNIYTHQNGVSAVPSHKADAIDRY